MATESVVTPTTRSPSPSMPPSSLPASSSPPYPIILRSVGKRWDKLVGSYGMLYSTTEKGQKKNFLMRCLVIRDILAIYGLKLEGEIYGLKLEGEQKEPFYLPINVKDYLSDQTSNYGELYKDLKGLVKNLNSGILAKLEPNVGSSDAFPGPSSGFYPERPSGVGGDIFVGPNAPCWFGSGEFPGSLGGLPGVPPGACFDPYSPPGVPGFEPGCFASGLRQPGSGTHPDVQFFPRDPDYM